MNDMITNADGIRHFFIATINYTVPRARESNQGHFIAALPPRSCAPFALFSLLPTLQFPAAGVPETGT
jgi:hypothetical protein